MPKRDIQDPSLEELDYEDTSESEYESSEDDRLDAERTLEEDIMWKQRALDVLGATLEAKFTKYQSKRSSKEQEWVSVLLQYNSNVLTSKEKGKMPQGGTSRKPPSANITRSRVDLAISRMRDIQFPLGGDYNFKIRAMIDPEVEQQINSTEEMLPPGMQSDPSQQFPADMQNQMMPPQPQMPQPGSVGMEAQTFIAEEHEKAFRMETKIRNQLSATKYGKRARSAMRDWALLGTGILKGPCPALTKKKFYNHYEDSEGGIQSELEVDLVDMPAVYCVDPRFFYPDYTALDPEDMEDCFEVHPMSRKQLIELADNPSFMRSRIRELIRMDPDGNRLESSLGLLHGSDSESDFSTRYLVKEYHGPVPKDTLVMLGEIDHEDEEDDLIQYYGEVWECQGKVIRVSLSPLDGDDSLPYHIAVWAKDDGSLFGHGMAYLMADQQRVVDATWKMLLDNAGLSAGPQIVLNKEAVEPANDKWELESMKIWYMTEYGGDVRSAFQFVDIPNNQQSLMNVIESAMQFADIESQTPMIQAHTEPQANVPAMNMGMVMTEANVHQRELSQHWDDNMTIPLVTRLVHYNIQYSSDGGIKGDFQVDVGGATERIDNQILAQDIERILATASQDPSYQMQIKPEEAFRRWVAATRAGPELLRTKEEVEKFMAEQEAAAQNAPPDPETIRAQAVMQREEARAAELQAKQQLESQKMQLDQQKHYMDMQMQIMQMKMKRAELMMRAREKELDLQIAMLQAEGKKELDIAKIQAQLQDSRENRSLQEYLKELDYEKFERELEVKRTEGTGI